MRGRRQALQSLARKRRGLCREVRVASRSERCEALGAPVLGRGRVWIEHESLILAQNERWRHA